jgi:hypothetical protein
MMKKAYRLAKHSLWLFIVKLSRMLSASRHPYRNAMCSLWIIVIWLLAPLLWGLCSTHPYFIPNARGLTVPATTVPVLAIVLAWALLLSFQRFQHCMLFRCAGGCLILLGLMLSYFSSFAHTCGFVLFTVGGALAGNAPGCRKKTAESWRSAL